MGGVGELRAQVVPRLLREDSWKDLLRIVAVVVVVVTDIQSTHDRLLLEPETEEPARVMSAEMARAEVRW